METEKAISFIEGSIMAPLLQDSNITDISYNGDSIFYLHNLMGRKKSEISIDSNIAKDFIRQIANLTEKQFSYQNPKLDVSVGRYRINAVHPSIARKGNASCLNFSIRIASTTPIITNTSSFLNPSLISLLRVLIRSRVSLLIGGLTGSGKTEFQKYLITIMEESTRLIVIDNILELALLPNVKNTLDINIWQADEKNSEASIQELVKNALRSNPDWLIVAESRGKEMIEVLNSAMTGHPIITTLHAFDINSMPTRIARMVLMNETKQDFQILMQDIFYNFRFYIYLKRIIRKDGKVKRFISEISEFDENGKKTVIYEGDDSSHRVYKMRKNVLKFLDFSGDKEFFEYFVGKNNE